MEAALIKLEYLIAKTPILISKLGEDKLTEKSSSGKWSKKEIIGHLIDSATNNHQRFVRGQFEVLPEISYNQDKWNEYGFYQQMDSEQLILFLTAYNKQILELVKRIPKENLERQVKVGEKSLTLEYLIIDYVEHLEYHLRQVIDI
jgi:hypothetical protein